MGLVHKKLYFLRCHGYLKKAALTGRSGAAAHRRQKNSKIFLIFFNEGKEPKEKRRLLCESRDETG